MSGEDAFGPLMVEPDYETAADAWLALEAIKLGMEFRNKAALMAEEYERRLCEERAVRGDG